MNTSLSGIRRLQIRRLPGGKSEVAPRPDELSGLPVALAVRLITPVIVWGLLEIAHRLRRGKKSPPVGKGAAPKKKRQSRGSGKASVHTEDGQSGGSEDEF